MKIFASFSGGGQGSALWRTALGPWRCAPPPRSPQGASQQSASLARAPPAWDPPLARRSASAARAAARGGDRRDARSKCQPPEGVTQGSSAPVRAPRAPLVSALHPPAPLAACRTRHRPCFPSPPHLGRDLRMGPSARRRIPPDGCPNHPSPPLSALRPCSQPAMHCPPRPDLARTALACGGLRLRPSPCCGPQARPRPPMSSLGIVASSSASQCPLEWGLAKDDAGSPRWGGAERVVVP